MHKTTLKFSELQKRFTGRILIKTYCEGTKSLPFSPVPNVESGLRCECGSAVWNATNFACLVHFCPDREIEVTVTDYTITKDPETSPWLKWMTDRAKRSED